MKILTRFLLLLITIGSLPFDFASKLEACTGLMLTAKDNSFVHGRTLEFGIPLEASIAVIPRNYPFQGKTSIGKGLAYSSKYAALGMMAFNDPLLLDGMNEVGLSVGTFYFPGYVSYSEVKPETLHNSLSPTDFPNWILTQFQTVEEVKEAVKNIEIVPTVISDWGPTAPPFHYIVYDKNAKSIVIEPLEGKLVVYDNPLGVLTNSPSFDWHLTNLNNYINLTSFNAKPVKWKEMEFQGFGQGSGMVGIPGDFTPPSRFVRAAIYTMTALPSQNSDQSLFQAFHILNQFDIPIGAVREELEGKIYTDSTLITCVRDPQKLNYYFKTYEDQTIKMVGLKQFDLTNKKIQSWKISGAQSVVNVSNSLK